MRQSLLKRIAMVGLTILLSVVILFSGVMAALAWVDFTQSRTNNFRGTVSKTEAELNKYEKDQNGNVLAKPVANAKFLLFRINADSTRTQINGVYTTTATGKIAVQNLGAGSYMFVETDPGYGYEYDQSGSGNITEYPFVITDEDAEGAIVAKVTAYNRRKVGSLEITKTVTTQDEEQRLLDMEIEFAFTVDFSEVGTYPYTIDGIAYTYASGDIILLKHGQTAVFNDLPVGLHYEVHETPVAGYVTTATGSTGSIEENTTAKAEFFNENRECPPEPIEIIVEKIVEGEVPPGEEDREFGFTFYRNDEPPIHFTLKAGEKSAPFVVNAGDSYRVVEDDPFPYGYVQTSVVNGSGTAHLQTTTVTYKNRYVGTIWTVISGVKTWEMGDDPSAEYPNSITVELLANGTVVQNATVTPGQDGRWTYSFTAHKFDEDGNEIEYTVREVPIPGFISKVIGTDIKNTWIETLVDAPAKVKKIITGEKPAVDDSFTFALTPQNGAPMPAQSRITIRGEGEGSFGNIRFTVPGTYRYQISEIEGNADCTYDKTVYILSVKVVEENGKLVVDTVIYNKLNDDRLYDMATFTNEYKPTESSEPEETQVSVKKVWVNGSNTAQPESATVQLYKDGSPYGSPVQLDANNKWTHTWTGLEKDATWTVQETNVPENYTSVTTGTASTGFVITNTYQEPGKEEVIISGVKTWNHGDNPAASRPTSITVIIKDGSKVVATAKVTEAEHWQWSFKLPKTRDDGTVIQYTVDESAVPGYTKTVDGFNITNTHTSVPEKPSSGEVLLSGKKTWNHNNAPQSMRPNSITVLIKSGTQTVLEIKVTEADNWKWSVLMPKYDKNGNVINYKVEEANVPGYTHQVNGYDITNIYKSPQYPGDNPKTGDSFNLILWLSISIGSVLVLAGILLLGHQKRRKNRSQGKTGGMHKRNKWDAR